MLLEGETCPRCHVKTRHFELRGIELSKLWSQAIEKVGGKVPELVKGVKGMISEDKIPERLEKGILRARHEVYVFKDGTVRFDATDIPLTHFKPSEIQTPIEKLIELGYTEDINGKPLEREDQIVKLKPQDVIIPESAGEYLLRTARFLNELLVKLYSLPPYYKTETRFDLIGELIIGLAPHTSAGITGRIIGFTQAHGCMAHPFWHAAKRRNCDGDEDALMLFLDVLLNFSLSFLPEKRGGKMDAPLVITSILDPFEIDDEAHRMEVVDNFSPEFYEATWRRAEPSEVAVTTVKQILSTPSFYSIGFTHSTTNVNGNVIQSRYVKLKSMEEKVDAQLRVAEKIRAIEASEVASLVINSHFLRDIYGNLRAFSKQKFRCVRCNAQYRRVPLIGKCTECGGKLILTVSEGNIRKYLEYSISLAEKYNLDNYLKQRLKLIQNEVESLFTNDLNKQISLAEFM